MLIPRHEQYGGGYEHGLHLFQDVYSAEDWSEPVVPLSDKILASRGLVGTRIRTKTYL